MNSSLGIFASVVMHLVTAVATGCRAANRWGSGSDHLAPTPSTPAGGITLPPRPTTDRVAGRCDRVNPHDIPLLIGVAL